MHGNQRRSPRKVLQRALQGKGTERRAAVRLSARGVQVTSAMDAPERYEQLIAYLDSQLPQPVDRQSLANGGVQFTGGDPAQVVVLLTDRSVVVSEFAGVWETPFRFVVAPRRIGLVKWRRLPETPLLNALGALIKGAREARLSQFQTCQ